tara:strand:+ start:304 stop:816 length:513 start_codon:yes stop_codon:yes gene_type:complete
MKSKNTLSKNKDSHLTKTSDQNFTLEAIDRSKILDSLVMGTTGVEIAKDLQISLSKFYKIINQDEKFKEEFSKAQEIGIRTLIEKMLMLFDNKPDNLDNADLIFLRERASFLKWLAPKVSSFFIDKQQHQVKTDQTLTIKFDNGFDDKEVINISDDATFEMTPPTSKETD